MSFGSPACDYVENSLDLNRFLISHPIATYFMKMQGDALKNAGIFNGDILVVDRSLPAADRRLIVAELNGELTARRFRSHEGSTFLLGEDGRTTPYRLSRKDRFSVWGVVTSVIRKI